LLQLFANCGPRLGATLGMAGQFLCRSVGRSQRLSSPVVLSFKKLCRSSRLSSSRWRQGRAGDRFGGLLAGVPKRNLVSQVSFLVLLADLAEAAVVCLWTARQGRGRPLRRAYCVLQFCPAKRNLQAFLHYAELELDGGASASNFLPFLGICMAVCWQVSSTGRQQPVSHTRYQRRAA